MFGLNESTQYYVCQRYVRMNMGINGLYQIVRTEMELPPLGGAVFIFFSKNRQQVKMLKWDGDGFLLYQKRLERGTFELPFFDPQSKQCKMPYKTLSAIMSGICLKSMRYRKKKEQAEKRKARKNNGAKRDMHCEMEEVHVTIDPVMDAELLKTLRLFGTRTCVRYSMEPIKFIKTVYHINTYTDGSILYPGKTPPALMLNSSYSPSFAAGLMQMRYIYSMPVERITRYFADNGFTLRKSTANKLIARSADVLENFYKAICQVVLQQDYVTADETYHKVLLTKIKPTDKGSKKGYLWAVSAPKLGLVFFVYEDGSRSEQVILNIFSEYKGTIQSDAYAPYRKLESDAYPGIMRIACLQHVKRDFVDCGKEDKDAQEVVDILNRFYREDKKHKVGVNGWTVEDHLVYRQSYAPDILQDLLEKLEEISSRKDLLPKSPLAQAVGYALNEYSAICDIFKRGDTALDNNYIERIQRYISLSRRNSMFFGSHEGARHGAILYSIAISCKLNNINLFEYIGDVIEKTIEWQPNTPLEKYRDLLPDRWKKQ